MKKTLMIPFPSHLARGGGVTFFIKMLSKYSTGVFDLVDLNKSKINNFQIHSNSLKIKMKRKYNYLINSKNINNADIVFFNPSLVQNAINRYIYLNKRLNHNNAVTFIHGWDLNYQKKINKSRSLKNSILKSFNKSKLIFVLANQFRKTLINWGVNKNKIQVTQTMVDDNLLSNFDKTDILHKQKLDNINILFLSRLEEVKGIYESIKAFKILTQKYDNLHLHIAGTGKEEGTVENICKDIDNITYHGFVQGDNKKNLFAKSNIYLLPTNHGEGCPISLLEAISFGIPSITTPVGGIKDFFIDNKMGEIIDDNSPDKIIQAIDNLLSDKDKLKEISLFNYNYGQENFMASEVVREIENSIMDSIDAK